jgi:LPXTG-motif cell wall-anchored protein
VGSGTGTEDEEEDPAAEPQPTDATLPGDWCDATTLAFLPGEAGTHEHAVALTAQAFEQGVPGWERVTWAATDRASVRAVAARHGDVVTLLTDGELSTGTLDEVEELLVCAEITDPPTDGTTTGAGDDEAEVLGLVLQRTDGAKAATSDGTEVLGVTLARTGFDAGWLAAVGALTLLAGGGVLTATRRRGSEAVA